MFYRFNDNYYLLNFSFRQSFKYDSGTALEGADSKDLGHLLEWELSLDSSDLRSHAWYHGNIPRARAEELVIVDGSFLVRYGTKDCVTFCNDI